MHEIAGKYPVTPDGRYFVVHGRLWRVSDPGLGDAERQRLVSALMAARREVGVARQAGGGAAEDAGRAAVDAVKRALGERGPVWWDDGAPDYNRRMARNSPYADCFAAMTRGAAVEPSIGAARSYVGAPGATGEQRGRPETTSQAKTGQANIGQAGRGRS